MSNCPDCGDSGGNHYNDCSYDGTGGRHYGGPGSVLGIQILIGIAILLGLRYPILGLIMIVVFMWKVITA